MVQEVEQKIRTVIDEYRLAGEVVGLPQLSDLLTRIDGDSFEVISYFFRLGRGIEASENFSPPLVTKFIGELAGALGFTSVLDPMCGTGCLLSQVVKNKPSCRYQGIDINRDAVAIARALLGEERIHQDNGFDPGASDNEFDLIVSSPPFGLALRDKDRRFFPEHPSLRDCVEGCLWLFSRKLSAEGTAIVLTPCNLFQRASTRLILDALGLAVRAVIDVPPKSLPSTSIRSQIVVLQRGEQSKMFVASLRSEPSHNQRVIANFLNQAKGAFSSGRWLDFDHFYDYVSAESSEAAKKMARSADLRMHIGRDVFFEVTSMRSRDIVSGAKELPPDTLTLFNGQIVDDVRTRPRSLFTALSLNTEVVSPQFFRLWVETSIGQEVLKSIYGESLGKNMKPSRIKQAAFYFPDLSRQEELTRHHATIRKIKGDLAESESRILDLNSSLSEIEDSIASINGDDSIDTWAKTLPYPLASIYARYRGAHADSRIRVPILLDFFEAFAAFLATIHVSAFASSEHLSSSTFEDLRQHLRTSNLTLERATFGTWSVICQVLSRYVRSQIESQQKEDSDYQAILAAYGIRDTDKLSRLCSSRLTEMIQSANAIRNNVAHQGALSETSARAMELELKVLVSDLRSIFGSFWERSNLLLVGESRITPDSYISNCRLLRGESSQFAHVERETSGPLLSDQLYLSFSDQSEPLRVLPFFRMGPTPQEILATCYFFNRSHDEGYEFVTYQHGDVGPEQMRCEQLDYILGEFFQPPS